MISQHVGLVGCEETRQSQESPPEFGPVVLQSCLVRRNVGKETEEDEYNMAQVLVRTG